MKLNELKAEVKTKIAMMFGPDAYENVNEFLKNEMNAKDLRTKAAWAEVNEKLAYSNGAYYLAERLYAKEYAVPGALRLVGSDNYVLEGREYDSVTKALVTA